MNNRYGSARMKKYNWEQVAWHLNEAMGSLASVREFAMLRRDGKRAKRAMTEGQLAAEFEHAYHHLNFAWNTRRMSFEKAESDFDGNEKWPVEFERFARK